MKTFYEDIFLPHILKKMNIDYHSTYLPSSSGTAKEVEKVKIQ
ncbi:hypothetical protein TREAZ_0257 [Leadbettera azotonutricia ZAS-9]|uniref:Uncharacterized protein n=1 Tax=Leadbettera azotonutricia (strain ATCC BAA-888 / DSM 13862 / ZAS-9) TaxID=545695 RepID=F5YE70_LEAAZ|nr:hypothetical protein TREAZ_0257 [Leadbettera azotonutricia ZAS-9]